MSQFVLKIAEHVRQLFEHDNTGHDWNHISRVYQMACYLQANEGGDKEIIELAALLHDISDHKLYGGILNKGGEVASELLTAFKYDKSRTLKIKQIIDTVSFKGANVEDHMTSLEGKIVQDADRLDAIGAIGIARTFAYGSAKNQSMYDPLLPPEMHNNFETYATAKTTTINHFYEKLLLLNDRLHTKTAKKIGAERHEFIVQFLGKFENEWNFKHYKK
jgi:uncharacterized protein